MNWLVEFEFIVPDFPESVELIQKVNETTFIVKAEKIPQEWIFSARITKM